MIAILAAGTSSRMRGRDKLLESVRGQPLLRVVVDRARATGLPVYVTLPPAGQRWRALRQCDVTRLPVADTAEGMAASFRAVARAADRRAVMACLADMPEIGTDDMRSVIDAWRAEPGRVIRAATASGVGGQPVIFPARLLPALAALTGDVGGRQVLEGENVRMVPLAGRRALIDLDTPEDWAAWRARTGDSG